MLCFPPRMVVPKKDNKRFSTVSKVEKACGKMPKKDSYEDDDNLETLMVKRAEREADEIDSLEKGSTPKHMKNAAKKVEAKAKETEKKVEKAIAEKKRKDAEAEKNRSKSYPVGPDETNFDPNTIEKVESSEGPTLI